MFRSTAIFTISIALSACGGSSPNYDGPTVTPIAASGFAVADSRVEGGQTYDVQNARRILGDENGVLSFDRQDVVYAISPDGSAVDVTIEGITYTAEYAADQDRYIFGDSDAFVSLDVLPVVDEVSIVDVFSVRENELNAALLVIGHDTDPETVFAASGTAEMNGRIFVRARQGFPNTVSDGDITLNVDFANDTVSGGFDIAENTTNPTITIPASSFTLEEAAIVGNGFAGDIRLASGDIGGTLSGATYDGRFYGADATTAGGQIGATILGGTGDDPVFVEGAFVVTE